MTTHSKRLALIVAGGTGGHMYPGIATARAILQQNSSSSATAWQVVFVVRQGDMGKGLIEHEGFQVNELPGQGFPRRFSLKMITFPFLLTAGFLKALTLIDSLKPDVVIGMGGYLSFPVLTAARLKKIPTLIHEQNVHPGIANQWLSRWVQSTAVSFAESQEHFQKSRVWLSGLPVRPDIGRIREAEGRQKFKLDENKTTFLIFGGSQGAQHLNQTAVATWPLLSEWREKYQVLHVTGERDFDIMRRSYENVPVHAEILPYCHDMAAALGAADLVICRAGASTIAELIVAHRPALLVPFPFASENHQFYNAEVMVKRGAAELIADTDFTPTKLAERLHSYFHHPERLPQMRARLDVLDQELKLSDAALRLAHHITTLS